MIAKDEWKWFGHPGHLIVARECQFHLCTYVGKYLISTVGEWMPGESVREVFAKHRGVKLTGIGDARYTDYLKKVGFEDVGAGRKYETMVFKAGEVCQEPGCDCGLPSIDSYELDAEGYNDAGSATRGHYAMCEKWANKE